MMMMTTGADYSPLVVPAAAPSDSRLMTSLTMIVLVPGIALADQERKRNRRILLH
jgi:hypothetical protein